MSGCLDKTVSEILEYEAEIFYVPCWKICGKKILFYSSCLLVLGQALRDFCMAHLGLAHLDKLLDVSICLSFTMLLWDFYLKPAKTNFLTSSRSRKEYLSLSNYSPLRKNSHQKEKLYISLCWTFLGLKCFWCGIHCDAVNRKLASYCMSPVLNYHTSCTPLHMLSVFVMVSYTILSKYQMTLKQNCISGR